MTKTKEKVNIDKIIKNIDLETFNRRSEISILFSNLNSQSTAPDKYFFIRNVVVFTYASLEKLVKVLSQHSLQVALEKEYFHNNNIKEFMTILKYMKNPSDLLEYFLLDTNNNENARTFGYINNHGYFGSKSRIDSKAIADIINVLNLNHYEPTIRVPKLSIDRISINRMNFAHGDYIDSLKKYKDCTDEESFKRVDNFIEKELQITDTTRDDIVSFINDFSSRIKLFILDAEKYSMN